MNVGWLIDGDMFPHYREELVAAIKTLGHEAKLIHAPNPPFRWDDVNYSYRETFPREKCVVSHGDIELVTKIQNEQRWKPGAFATVENYYCSNYVVEFGSYWLNRDYIMMPFGELIRNREFLFETLGVNGEIFVRPDSPLKLFMGQTAGFESFQADVDYMGSYDFPKSAMVVVSSPKRIVAEWRFVAVNRNIVAGCIYSQHGKFDPQPEIDPDAKNLATEIASREYSPDDVWIIDICETADSNFYMLEIGGFSFADLYACDKSKVVNAVSDAALLKWQNDSLQLE